MRLGEGVEWGVHAAALLAVVPSGAALPAARIAEYLGVPAAYLSKHLQAMARAEVVEAVPGPRGGYRLARPPAEISVLDCVEAIDGDEAAFRCTEIRRRGPAAVAPREYRLECGIHRAMLRADAAWRAELSATSIADVIETVLLEASPRAITLGVAWLQEALR